MQSPLSSPATPAMFPPFIELTSVQDILDIIEIKKAEFARSPLFQIMQDSSISPLQRLGFSPCIAHFIMRFGNLNKYLFRDESSNELVQNMIISIPMKMTIVGIGSCFNICEGGEGSPEPPDPDVTCNIPFNDFCTGGGPFDEPPGSDPGRVPEGPERPEPPEPIETLPPPLPPPVVTPPP